MSKKRYTVDGEVTISVHVDVMASSHEEARRLASSAGIKSLCHQCARSSEIEAGEVFGEWCTSGDLDGEVTIRGSEVES